MELTNPYDLAYVTTTKLDEQHVLLTENAWIRICRQFHGNQRLFGVHNRNTGRTTLAAWVYSPAEAAQPLFVEIEGFDGDPNQDWPFQMPASIMRSRLKPIQDDTQRPFKQALQRKRAKEAEDRYLDSLEKRDLAAHHMRQGRADVASAILRRPFAGAGTYNDEQRREISKQLYDAIKRIS
jgi:hypothetical protein